MATVTVASLITRIKQRTDNEHSGSEFVTDDEIVQLINQSHKDLVGHLTKAGLLYRETEFTAVTTGPYDSNEFPDDFFALVNVWRVDSSGRRYRIPRHDARHSPLPSTVTTGIPFSYRVKTDTDGVQTLELSPVPSQDSYVISYVPKPADLTDSDDLVMVGGWEEYIVVDVSAKIRQKEQQLNDAQLLKQDKAEILAAIQEEATMQEMNETYVVQTSRRSNRYWFESDDDTSDLADGEYVDRRGYRGRI